MDDALIEALADALGEQLAPLVRRLDEVERRAPVVGDKGEPGKDGRDGKDVDPDVVREMIATTVRAAVAELPRPKDGEPGRRGEKGDPGRDGKDTDPDAVKALIDEAVKAAVAEIPHAKEGPPGRDGEQGPPGKDGENGKDADPEQIKALVHEIVASAVKALPQPKDGRDGEPGTRGEKGDQGRDGRDAGDLALLKTFIAEGVEAGINAALATLKIASADDGRTLRLSFAIGEREIAAETRTAIVLDRGVWREGSYEKGDGVTFGGSFFIAQRATDAKPETNDSGWRLAVKRGRDGKEGKPGKDGKGEKGDKGDPGPRGYPHQ